MAKTNIDLSKFKHVSSDAKSTKLRHADGHFLVLAHGKLGKDFQKQLAALSSIGKEHETADQANEAQAEPQRQQFDNGGEVERPIMDLDKAAEIAASRGGARPKDTRAHANVRPTEESAMGDGEWPLPSQTSVGKAVAAKKEQGMAKGGRVMMAEGGIPQTEQLTPEQLQAAIANMPQEAPVLPANGQIPMVQQTVQPINVMDEIKRAGQSVGNYLMAPAGTPLQYAPAVQAQLPQVETPQAEVPVVQEAPVAPQRKPDAIANSMGDAEGMMAKGYQSKLQGINAQAAAQGKLGEQQAQVLNQAIQHKQEAQAAFQEHYNSLEQERQAHMADIKNGYIDPNQYWTGDKNGNGGHSKIAAGIGMILAGFNPTNSPNAAINFLKNQMDMNIKAQETNLGAKQNLLAANLRQFGNLKDATDMTRLMQSDIMQQELATAAAKAQSPMAKAAALNAAGQLQMESAPLFQQFAMRRAMMGMTQNGSDPGAVDHMLGYMRVMNPEMAKEMESRYIPKVGMASVPVTPEVRNNLQAHQSLDAAIKNLYDFVRTHNTLVPGTPDYVRGQQKAMDLQTKIRESKLNTVYREGEKPLLDKFIQSNPAGVMKNLITIPQLKELSQSNSREFNILKQNYGLPVQHQTQELGDNRQQAIQWAKANPKDPRAAEILKRLGGK